MTLTASEAKNRFGRLLDSAQCEPVMIEKNGRPFAVLLSRHDYDRLQQELAELRSQAETDVLMRGENGPRLMAAVEAHRRGEPGIVKTLEELQAMSADAD